MGSEVEFVPPDYFTLDYLCEHHQDPELAKYIRFNFNDIIDGIRQEDRGRMCYALSRVLIECSYSPDESTNHQFVRAAMRICRIGLNGIADTARSKNTTINMETNPDVLSDVSELYAMLAMAEMALNRPFLALELMDRAERYVEKTIFIMDEVVKKVPSLKEYHDSLELGEHYEFCRGKEAEFWAGIFFDLDDSYKQLMESCIESYYQHTIDNLYDMGSDELAAYFNETADRHAAKVLESGCFDVSDFSSLNDVEYREPDLNVYGEWCWYNVLLLTPTNDVPNIIRPWLKDDISFNLSEVGMIRMEDILSTYDHCRRLVFEYQKIPIEERFKKGRDNDVEKVLDCYYRLYSILDKVSKVINELFPQDLDESNVNFKNIVELLITNSNKYLRGIYDINHDMFPTENDWDNDYIDPFIKIEKVGLTPSKIRNTIAHSAIKFVKPEDEYKILPNVVTMSAEDLEHHVIKLMALTREVLLNLQLAVNHEKKFM